MMATSIVFVPVGLDCGCTVTPRVLNGEEPHTSGGALVHCPDHGIRHDVEVESVVITVTYSAKRIDPADTDPGAEVLAELQGDPHVYTIAAVLHGIATAPCTICGAGRNGSLRRSGVVAEAGRRRRVPAAYPGGAVPPAVPRVARRPGDRMSRAERVPSRDLTPGTKLRHKPTGDVVVLKRRKKPGESEFGYDGWWLKDGIGGLADRVIDDPDSRWEVIS